MGDPGISGAGSGVREKKRGHWLLKLFHSYPSYLNFPTSHS